uniref:Flagellar attachment zone protein 1 conserved domain-containing protein n=1 Tax=Trypanosoma congolense (strain IL3000) TaxID=1068625 RepID=G0UQ72_TRYCI|nr:conserved hypothetical protein [Trypanosoma congolense IL3000]
MTTNALLSFAVALLLVGPISALADSFLASSKSYHSINFVGDKWDFVVQNKPNELSQALRSDIDHYVQRPGSFLTDVTVHSLNHTESSLSISVSVEQVVRTELPDAERQHVWPADEVNSLLMQTNYSATFDLYDGPEKPELTTVRVVDGKLKYGKCTTSCKRLTHLTTVLVVLMGVSLFIVLIYMIVNCCRTDPSEKKHINENCLMPAERSA